MIVGARCALTGFQSRKFETHLEIGGSYTKSLIYCGQCVRRAARSAHHERVAPVKVNSLHRLNGSPTTEKDVVY